MSRLEKEFEKQLNEYGLIPYLTQYRAVPKRQFRFDFAFPKESLLIEIQGGVWSRGAHGRGSGIVRDYEKLNLAVKNGFFVLQFDTNMVKSKEGIELVKSILENRRN